MPIESHHSSTNPDTQQTEQTEIKEGEALTERKQKYKKERNTRWWVFLLTCIFVVSRPTFTSLRQFAWTFQRNKEDSCSKYWLEHFGHRYVARQAPSNLLLMV